MRAASRVTVNLHRYVQSGLDQPIAECFRYRFGLRMHLQFLIDVLEMKIDRGRRDAQFFSSSLVVMPFNQELEDSDFMRREVVAGALGRANLAKQFDYAARDFR